jgi:hypothetical protein
MNVADDSTKMLIEAERAKGAKEVTDDDDVRTFFAVWLCLSAVDLWLICLGN